MSASQILISPMLRHLHTIAAGEDKTKELKAKRQDTINKIKDLILNGNSYKEWAYQLVWSDSHRIARQAIQEYCNMFQGIDEKNTVTSPWFLFTAFAVRDKHALLTKVITEFLDAMVAFHGKKQPPSADFWRKNIETINPLCLDVHKEYIKIAPPLTIPIGLRNWG